MHQTAQQAILYSFLHSCHSHLVNCLPLAAFPAWKCTFETSLASRSHLLSNLALFEWVPLLWWKSWTIFILADSYTLFFAGCFPFRLQLFKLDVAAEKETELLQLFSPHWSLLSMQCSKEEIQDTRYNPSGSNIEHTTCNMHHGCASTGWDQKMRQTRLCKYSNVWIDDCIQISCCLNILFSNL